MIKMNIRYLLLLLSAYSTAAFSQGTWTSKAAMGISTSARAEAIAFSIGHKGYMGLGTDFNGTLFQDLWEYDPITNAWTQKANYGGAARRLAVAFAVSGKGYVGTGSVVGNLFTTDFWEYNPTSNAWTQRSSMGGVGRNSATAFSIGTFGYVCTGVGSGGSLQEVWRYSPSLDQWTQRANFTGGLRRGASSFVLNGLGYVGLGLGSDNLHKSDIKAFNPVTNIWTSVATFPGVARSLAIGFNAGNFGYMGAGTNGTLLSDMWRFDPGTNSWSSAAALPTTLRSGACFALAGRGYVGTGTPTTGTLITRNFFEYTPASTLAASNSWTRKADFGGSDRVSAVGFAIGSKGYIGTGTDAFTFNTAFWEFDPATNTWAQKASFAGTPRSGAVGFAIGGKGYVGTGAGSNGSLNDFWEYNPSTNAWLQKANVGGNPRRLAVGFAIGSKGYVGTGAGGTNDFWQYDPSTNTWVAKADYPGTGQFSAVGFSIGNKGYVGTGSVGFALHGDFWEYDAETDAWSPKANFAGGARTRAVGFSIGTKGYIGTGQSGVNTVVNDFWQYDPSANTWTPRANFSGTARGGAVGFGIGSKGYIGTGLNGDVFFRDLREYEPGPVNCSGNGTTLALSTDKFSTETTWEIRPSGVSAPICNGSGYASNTTIDITCCLPDGCYDLRVFDSFGDGILTPGGYVLKDAANRRIVDNLGNGSTFTTLSQVTNGNLTPWSFCVPLGTDALVPSSCDQVFTLNSTVTIQVQENPAVTGLVDSSPPLITGYQICIFDPNGGFRRNVFQSFGQPGSAFPPGTSNALKPTFFNLNFSQGPFLPVNKLLNVRVRAKMEGVFLNCGPACRLVVGTPPCTTTKLTTTATPQISCGAQNVSVNGGQLFCDLVPGANRYRFQFAGPNNYLRNVLAPAAAVNSLASRTLTLNVFQQQPLPCGVPLTVRVQASFDGGLNFCPFGQDCIISVTGCPVQLRSVEDDALTTGLSIWPNPNDGSRLNIRLEGIAADIATVELADAYGKFVRRGTISGTGSGTNSVLDLGGDIAEGLYFVTITAGGETFTERVMITR